MNTTKAFYSGKTDEELAVMSQSGDKNALSVLLMGCRSFVESISSRYIGVSLEKDDLFQEGMLAVLSAVYTYDPEKNSSFKAYAGVCVNNRLRSALRSENENKNIPLNTYIPLDDLNISGGTEPENKLISLEETEVLYKIFDRDLSALEKKVLICRLEGLSYSDISQKLNITEKAADNAMQRTRAKLKRLLF
ncbi:MAG: sigma-70 family RNA polymerase sigma factor [Oscillospiraceae bacterium]|nr:sigma-70 family RNA polymerase sigma factor [Oscillospiraceae bacterium]